MIEKLLQEVAEDYGDFGAEIGGFAGTLQLIYREMAGFDGSETRDERNTALLALHSLLRGMERFNEFWHERDSEYALKRSRLMKEFYEVYHARQIDM